MELAATRDDGKVIAASAAGHNMSGDQWAIAGGAKAYRVARHDFRGRERAHRARRAARAPTRGSRGYAPSAAFERLASMIKATETPHAGGCSRGGGQREPREGERESRSR